MDVNQRLYFALLAGRLSSRRRLQHRAVEAGLTLNLRAPVARSSGFDSCLPTMRVTAIARHRILQAKRGNPAAAMRPTDEMIPRPTVEPHIPGSPSDHCRGFIPTLAT